MSSICLYTFFTARSLSYYWARGEYFRPSGFATSGVNIFATLLLHVIKTHGSLAKYGVEIPTSTVILCLNSNLQPSTTTIDKVDKIAMRKLKLRVSGNIMNLMNPKNLIKE